MRKFISCILIFVLISLDNYVWLFLGIPFGYDNLLTYILRLVGYVVVAIPLVGCICYWLGKQIFYHVVKDYTSIQGFTSTILFVISLTCAYEIWKIGESSLFGYIHTIVTIVSMLLCNYLWCGNLLAHVSQDDYEKPWNRLS